MSDDIAPDVQAKRLAELRAAHPLPAPSEHMMALLSGVATWAGRSIAGAAAFGGPEQTDAADVDATAPAPSVTAKREQAPVRGRDLPFSSNPPPEIETQSLARALEADRLIAAGLDPWAPLVPPDAREDLAAFNRSRIDPAAEQPSLPLPNALLPELGKAKARRQSAQASVDEALKPLARVAADLVLLQRDIDSAKDLPDDIAKHYAAQIAAGRPAKLDAALKQRVTDRDAAQRQLDALQSAIPQLQKAADKATAEHAKAQAGVEQVVLAMIAGRAEQLAIEAIEARNKWVECKQQLLNLGAIRLGNKSVKLSFKVWQAVNDEPEKPALRNDLVQEWMRAALEIVGDADA